MSRKFRLTCARTAYFEIELEATSCAHAEEQLPALLQQHPGLGERDALMGQPVYRIVEIAPAREESGSDPSRAQAA